MKRLLSIFILCMVCLSAGAEWKWQNPMDAGFPVIQNQGWPDEIGQTYVRLPDRAKAEVREPLWNLSRNSAGLAIHFYCNSPQITVRYQVSGGGALAPKAT
ncbi:SGNH/GDSL hydrolase N-terminal domain-containing protein, partial [uncultured Parabacteroides sp.]|uniref:SGNH/GDSL hydrolase N-terminal domain-containing protein n=1 Tax=uncultured Parabacteroides sp. TaxID=512312 RepID=UPI0025D6B2F3